MTVDERFEQLERKTQRLEKRNKRLTVALTMTVVAMCAVVTMAATDDKDGVFDTVMANAVMARSIYVMNDAGQIVIDMGKTDNGNGLVTTMSAKGNDLVQLSTSVDGYGMVKTYQPNGKRFGSFDYGGIVDSRLS